MQTEKQVEKMLEAIDEKTVDILNRKRKEHTKMYNEDEAKKALRAIEIDPDIESEFRKTCDMLSLDGISMSQLIRDITSLWIRIHFGTRAEYRYGYASWLLALMDIANALGYDWKDEIADRIKLWNLKPLA